LIEKYEQIINKNEKSDFIHWNMKYFVYIYTLPNLNKYLLHLPFIIKQVKWSGTYRLSMSYFPY